MARPSDYWEERRRDRKREDNRNWRYGVAELYRRRDELQARLDDLIGDLKLVDVAGTICEGGDGCKAVFVPLGERAHDNLAYSLHNSDFSVRRVFFGPGRPVLKSDSKVTNHVSKPDWLRKTIFRLQEDVATMERLRACPPVAPVVGWVARHLRTAGDECLPGDWSFRPRDAKSDLASQFEQLPVSPDIEVRTVYGPGMVAEDVHLGIQYFEKLNEEFHA